MIKILNGNRLSTLTNKVIEVTRIKVNVNSPISPELHGIPCKMNPLLSYMHTKSLLAVRSKIYSDLYKSYRP